MRIGFYAWNPFQIYQVESIVRHLPEGSAEYIIEKRGNIDFGRVFTREFLESLNAPVHFIARGDMKTIDQRYDAVVCQTAFGKMEELKRAKIISMQYSMSKERHQYGTWRVLCDLNLVYGQYSYDRISPLSPSVMVGNPRFDRLFEGALETGKKTRVRESLDPSRKTVLYLPTWGDLSSIVDFGAAVAALSAQYNVIAKVHHKTDTHELSKKEILGEKGIRETFGAADDMLYLMDAADVVLSDYSGAIFDALNAGKPVILLQKDPEAVIGAEKFGLESIEYARRDEIGPVVDNPENLMAAVDDVLSGKLDYAGVNKAIRAESFSQQSGSGKKAAEAILSFLDSPIERPVYQTYLCDAIIDARRREEAYKGLKKMTSYGVLLKKPAKFIWSKTPSWLFYAHGICVRAVAALVVKAFWAPGREKVFAKITRIFSPLVHSLVLTELAQRYDRGNTEEISLILAREAFRKSRMNGLTVYIKLLDKYNRSLELSQLADKLLSLPVKRQARILSRLERLSEIIKYRIEDVRLCREAVRHSLLQDVTGARGGKKALHAFEILLSNRWNEEVARNLPGAGIQPEARKKIARRLELSKERMKKWAVLTEIANRNRMPGLSAGGYECFYRGQVTPVAAVNAAVVEFMLPPYFYEDRVSNSVAHARICAMLRSFLDALSDQGFAIVPQHQFRLNDACPSGHWQAVSYHTTGDMPSWHHLKDAHIPGYFSMDSRGYSGWSTLAGIGTLPPASEKDIAASWDKLQQEVVHKKISKYEQAADGFKKPLRPFVFLPMQILTDTVATLAYIPSYVLAGHLAEMLPDLGYDLVVKRHPLCADARVGDVMRKLRNKNNVYLAEASIHEILPEAAAVVTVNSGVGFEALAYGKKVILTGAADYAYAAETAKNRTELEAALKNLPQPADVARIKAFLHYYMTEYVFDAGGVPRMIGRSFKDKTQSAEVDNGYKTARF